MRTPSEPEIIREYFRAQWAAVHVSFVARVLKYDAKKQTAEIVPSGPMRGDNGRYIKPEPIANVPIMFPGGGGWEITWGISRGDLVDVVINDHSLEEWKDSGRDVTPADRRAHALSDAKAYPQLASVANPRRNASRDLYIGRADGSIKVELSNQAAQVVAGLMSLSVSTTGVSLGSSAADVLGILGDSLTALTTGFTQLQAEATLDGGTTGTSVYGGVSGTLTTLNTLLTTIRG